MEQFFAVDLKTAEAQIQINMTNPIPPDVKRFRVSLMAITICMFTACLIGIVGGYVAILIHHGRVDLQRFWWVLKVSSLRICLCWLIGTFAVYFSFIPVGFSPVGIYAASFWAFRRFIGWQDIVKIRKIRLLNLTFLRLYSSMDGKVTWLAIFPSHKKEFQDEIRKFAPADSPILKFLN